MKIVSLEVAEIKKYSENIIVSRHGQKKSPYNWSTRQTSLDIAAVLPTNFQGKLLKEGWFVAKSC